MVKEKISELEEIVKKLFFKFILVFRLCVGVFVRKRQEKIIRDIWDNIMLFYISIIVGKKREENVLFFFLENYIRYIIIRQLKIIDKEKI